MLPHAMLTLEEYRLAVVQKLNACTDAARLQELLAEANAHLGTFALGDRAQKAFWQRLSHDLSLIAHRMSQPPERQVVRARAIIAAAQATIAKYQGRLGNSG